MSGALQITRDQTVALATAPGQRLRPDAAAAWDTAAVGAQAALGFAPTLTDSFRPFDVQERIFRERYRQGNHVGQPGFTTDVRSWIGEPWTRLRGQAAAAVPGTSNHGGGVAVDAGFSSFTDPRRAAFLDLAGRHGWTDDEGRAVDEPWHLRYDPANDGQPTVPLPTGTGITAHALSEESLEVLMSYPFLFRGDTNDGVTLVLSPTKQITIPAADWNNSATNGEIKALTDDGKVHTVGAGTAAALRGALK